MAALFELSRNSPRAWRRADAVGRTTGLVGQRLERAFGDAVGAGLVDRRVDDSALVLLTDLGRAVVERKAPWTSGWESAPAKLVDSVEGQRNDHAVAGTLQRDPAPLDLTARSHRLRLEAGDFPSGQRATGTFLAFLPSP